MNSNKELLDWAVENIKEWDDEFTHVRCDYNFVQYTTGHQWIRDNVIFPRWFLRGKPMPDVRYKIIKIVIGVLFMPAQVITKQEWLDAKKEKEGMVNVEAPFGKQLFGHKIKVKDEEQFNLVQEAVEGAGGRWMCGNKLADYEPRYPFLYINEYGIITRGRGIGDIRYSELPELILEAVKTLRIVETIPAKSEQDTEKENLQKVIDKLQQDLQNAQQQLDNLGGK